MATKTKTKAAKKLRKSTKLTAVKTLATHIQN